MADLSALSPEDRDWIIRTVAGEADAPGQAAVASVIKNRLQKGGFGSTGKDVVLAPGQFSMWNGVTGFAHGAGANSAGTNLDPSSETYKNIGNTVDNVFSGKTPDPTKGALNYYAPGGASPAWASSLKNPVTIGGQIYGTAGPGRPSTPTPPPQAPGPVDPSIIARGGTGPPLPAGTTINTPAPYDWAKQLAPAGKGEAPTLEDNIKKALGIPDTGDQPMKLPPLGPPPGARNVSPLLASPQTYGQTLNSLVSPLKWGPAPPGASPYNLIPPGGRQYAAQPVGMQAPAQAIGTSLNSLQAMDPDTYQQQLAMLYGAGAGGATGGSYG